MINEFLQPFWETFEKYGNNIAIVDKQGRQTTYSELYDLIQKLAYSLDKLNLPENTFIPILLPTSLEYIASMMAIWRAGHTPVPISISYPVERIEYIINHSEAPLVIDEKLFSQLASSNEKLSNGKERGMNENALLIYTSGSTGEPKGIIHTFESLLFGNLYGIQQPVDPTQKWGATAPLYFIAGVTINFKVLRGGGELHLYDDEIRFDPLKMADYIAEKGITHTFISPSMLGNFKNKSDSLKTVYAGSEKVSNQTSRDGYTLYNIFGMSEMVGGITPFRVDQPYDATPIGYPNKESGFEFRIVDNEGNDLPQGQDGELIVKGHFAKEYYKDPEKTAKLYDKEGWLHTGDIMRLLPDGALQYVNRKDWMVKINGQRVEPGEVESVMKKVDGVKDAIVKGFNSDNGSQFIVGYYIVKPEEDLSPEKLKNELKKKLPAYMVPRHLVRMDVFPLLPNGKVNRKILEAPSADELTVDYVAPRNNAEKEICNAFAEVFNLKQVGIKDDFFSLGGDSIKVMKLQQLCKNFDLTSKLIYKERTPENIANAIEKKASQSVIHDNLSPVPLTQTQAGIYAESMSRQGEASYNIPQLFKLDISVDLNKLAHAIEKVVEAHPFLKVKIEEDKDGNPVMVPQNNRYEQEITKLSDKDFNLKVDSLIKPIDLTKDNLFRINIFDTGDNRYLFMDFHHIIYDGTSMLIFLQDLNKAYSGEIIPKEEFTGFDIALEENALRNSEVYQEAREWYEYTFGGIEVDSLPIPDNHEEDVRFASFDYDIDLSPKAVQKFCNKLGISANVLNLGAFGKLLGTFVNSREALFATIYNGRTSSKVERTIDMMVKTLPVYCKWNSETKIEDYLKSIQQQLFGSMSHDIYSFADLAASTGINSDIIFAYQGDYLEREGLLGFGAEEMKMERNATGSPLDFQVFIIDGKLSLHVEYMCNRYSNGFIGEMARSFASILKSLMKYDLMSEIEITEVSQIELLDSFNNTEVEYDKSQSVISLFEKAVEEYPENIAVIYEDKRFSYRDTDLVTDKVAAEIESHGLGNGDIVSILIPRSEWMVMASLGALKTGCTYQPLDHTYPKDRLNFMVKDSGAKLLITTEELHQYLDEYEGKVLYISGIERSILKRTHREKVAPDTLFTLLYTSGSTGVPKGVKLNHANMVCFIDWYVSYYDLQPGNCVGAYASYGFDANMMDMYPALCRGAAVCIVPEDIRLDMEQLNSYLVKNNVSHMFMTTQVGRQFASDIEKTSLKYLSMGGEKLISFPVPEGYKTYNVYGPTECTILSSIYPLRKGETDIPIGKILDNMKGYIVSEEGKRLPVGAVGELWIAGPHVAEGYLNRPEKTAEVFIMNPFTRDGHKDSEYIKVYRTGDMVRYRADGNIDFVGRSDGQVKIRGFRIELSEVEAVIREFEGIRNATVVAFDHPSGGKYIAAYVVSDSPVDVNALNDFIRERKPPYMVPAVTMQIDSIPLNQNHKVNKRALPEPEFNTEVEEPDNNRPLNILEKEIMAIVGKVLGHESFGVTTPFNNVGLTSILSIKLASQIFKRFGVEVHSKALLNGGSIETVENIILDKLLNADFGKEEGKKEESSKLNSSPLSFPQTGVYFECMKRPADITYNIPAMFRFGKEISAEKLVKALKDIVSAHQTLASRFENTEKGVMQVVIEDYMPEVKVLQMSHKELENYKKSFVKPFHLSNGPLYRFEVVETPDGNYLLTDFHHLVFDGTSLDIFLHQLKEALDGKAPEKEAYPYTRYVADEKDFEASDSFKENAEYYARMLSKLENVSEIPADLKGKEAEGKLKNVASPFDLEKVESFARNMGITPAAVMLAATFYTVSRYVNDSHVYLSTISSGRSDVRTGDTIGMFVNTLPLAIKIGDESSESFIRRCAEIFRGVLDHEKYPFAKIAADFGYKPEIVYEYQLGVIGNNEFPELKDMESLELDIAKFKVSVHIELSDGKPSVVVFYNDALYSRKLMEGIARSIVIVTDHILANPSKLIKNVSLVDELREKELEKFRTVAIAEPKYQYFQEAVEYFAQITPSNPALIACDAKYTYQEFDDIANCIANNLIRLGVTPRSKVALLLPRTSKVILSMYGVMKAGSAYIPCDPEYPVERIQHILNDSEATYVITTADRLKDFSNAIDIETLLEGDKSRPVLEITPKDLAYLIYTSGSTGKPKGVMLRHESIANYLLDNPANTHIHALATRAHTLLSITTISFDMSLKEIGAALNNGLTLVFANEEETTNPILLSKLFRETKADAFNTTPSRMLQFMELPAFAEAIGQCKVIMCGGEKYADGLLDKLRSAAPEAQIFNTYGPTEITVSSNCKDLTHTDHVSVGKPLLNVTEFVVDKDGNELPSGIVGELYIGGLGVATGYNNLPEMTSERFIDYQGLRIYKSGDYARWTQEGDVEILGRTDNQIKLRGLRIELGEVEAAIASIPGVKNVVVKIVKIKGEEHLAAYFVADHKIDITELKTELGRNLTKYMVPTAYLQMEKFPLTPNGKTDVKSLPDPEIALSGEYEAPANETEQNIANIFAKILKLDKVGANDSFYELGGTSLVTTRVIIETDKLGYNVAYGDVFANPTPRKLANFILGISDEDKEKDEVKDYDYSAINSVLKQNNLEAFRLGESLNLGKVLLTGATGYLGIHILKELIDSNAVEIYCLVRAKEIKEAEERLKTLLFYYFENTFDELFGNRLHIIPGDVTSPIDKSIYTDTLVNCAAIVKHFAEGTEIEDVNVGGVEHCIDYCLATGAKMIQISTASTRGMSVNGVPAPGNIFNEEKLYMGQYLGNKYILSKFLAERLVLETVAKKGLVAKIMRVGNLAPRSTDGEFQVNFQTNSFMGRLKVYNMLGCCPFESRDLTVEFSPINEVAKAIITLSTTPKECIVFHPYNNHNVLFGDVLSELRHIGEGVKFVEIDKFSKALDEAKEDPAKARQLSSLLAYQNMAKGKKTSDVLRQNAYTMQVLYRLGFSWSVTSWDYVDKFISAIEGLGFFD
ncbi:MAG: amino acid adenylation domain-containing protein [Muribaculaceae bacterium]|nr:amino acid adenylation domain-containing protein [Muribaculaceae bacterium]